MQANSTINDHHDIRIAGKKGFYSNIIKKMFTDIDYVYLIGKLFKIYFSYLHNCDQKCN